MIKEAKTAYFTKIKKIVKEAGNTKSYFHAVRLLQSVDAPTRWQIQSMFPGLSDGEIAERAAAFFNSISQEYQGLDRPTPQEPTSDSNQCPELFEVAAKLKYMKKPKSTVVGDIHPKLVAKYVDIIAIPLHFIFKQVFVQAGMARNMG